jgi:hypothetical protein
MPPSREEKLHHILTAIEQAGALGATRSSLETWVQLTFRASGQSVFYFLRDIRVRQWARDKGGRYTLTEDGRKELASWEAERVIAVTVRAPALPSAR